MHIEPDAEIAAVRPAEAMNILNTWLADSDLEVNPLKHRLTGKGTAMQLLYPFEVRDSEDKVVYYVVNGLPREIYTGEQSEDGVIPLDLVQGPPENEASRQAPPYKEPSGDPLTYETGETVKAQDLIVTVHSVYGTNLRLPMGGEPIEERREVGTYLFIHFTVINDSDVPVDLEDRFGVVEIFKDDGGSTETLWNVRLADITDRVDEIRQNRYLPQTDYSPSLTLQAGATLELQAECAIQGRDFPVLFTLRSEGGKDSAYINITPDPVEYVPD